MSISTTPEVVAAVAAVARASKRNGDPSSLPALKRDLAAAKIAAYVERIVAEAPPLTSEQRDRIATLLHGGRS